jgi:diphosphomevalonate decarboxylase
MIQVCSPSNIALLKYMGKVDSKENIPANPSLSLTLSGLSTHLKISPSEFEKGDSWSKPLPGEMPGNAPDLSPESVKRFIDSFSRLRIEVKKNLSSFPFALRNIDVPVRISSTNTFPHSAGIASSASAFSALTLGFFAFYAEDLQEFKNAFQKKEVKRMLAAFSRKGSGSSCRSFEGPWVGWDQENTSEVATSLPPLSNLILIAGKSPKTVSSGEAHRRVLSSPLWKKRAEEIRPRYDRLKSAIQAGLISIVSEIAYEEFLEMHELFHTAQEAFTYWNDETRVLLQVISQNFSHLKSQAIFTMDAGPNIHCLVPTEGREAMKAWWSERFPNLEILEDSEGMGARILS